MGWYDYGFAPYVSVGERRANALKELGKLEKKGYKAMPVKIDGLKIASTFWGKAWCENLESYSDYSNRLPRGRTYVRNGSVVDLQITPGKIFARVSGSDLYEVNITISPLEKKQWESVRSNCAGQIGSLVELLQGKLSNSVMEIVTGKDRGLFPAPAHIDMDCSCPDSAGMCKHIAAVLYGVGSRLDRQPDLLFTLRKVDHLELISAASAAPSLKKGGVAPAQTIATGDLADVFGIELDDAPKAQTIAPSVPVKHVAGASGQIKEPSPKPRGRRKSATAVSAKAKHVAKLAKVIEGTAERLDDPRWVGRKDAAETAVPRSTAGVSLVKNVKGKRKDRPGNPAPAVRKGRPKREVAIP